MQATVVGQVPVIPFQPHPIPVGRQSGSGAVQGAAHRPKSQAERQNGTKPTCDSQTEGSELQLPLHDSGLPAPPLHHRPNQKQLATEGGVFILMCEAETVCVWVCVCE